MSERLTAMDVEKQEFRRSMRGFDPDDVRLYLRSVAEEIERLNLDNGRMLEEIGQLRREVAEHRAHEQSLQQTLVTAQSMAQEVKQRSSAEADLIVREARLKAERTLHETQDQLARLESEISRAKLERDLFEKRLRLMVEEHLSLLDRRREDRDELDNVRVLARRSGAEAG